MRDRADIPSRRPRPARRLAGGFTMVEMLIVIGVIIVLLSILIVGLNLAMRTAQGSHTQALLRSISDGLVRFKEDIGYLPPILGPQRQLAAPPAMGTVDQNWFSLTSLADYIVGYGTHQEDGYGYVPGADNLHDWDNEQPPTGIRHPRRDGVWGATSVNPAGLVTDRMKGRVGAGYDYGSETGAFDFDLGPVYGPYIELDSRRLLGSLVQVGGEWQARFQGDAGYDANAPKVICDFWGEPVQYYRKSYPAGAPDQEYRSLDYNNDGLPDPVPSLSDFFCLRPFKVDPGSATDSIIVDGNGDTTSSYELESAAFALFSRGPDRHYAPDVRYDELDEFNKDNIVEVGR